MNIKQLLQADSLPAVDRPKIRGAKAHEIEFDLITVLARQLRRLRKSGGSSDTAMAQFDAPDTITQVIKAEAPIQQDASGPRW